MAATAGVERWRRRQRSGGVGCSSGSLAVAGSGAVGRRQRRQQSGGGGGSTALAAARWQRRRRRQSNHPCHGAANSVINCSRTAWQRNSVLLRTEGRRPIAGGTGVGTNYLELIALRSQLIGIAMEVYTWNCNSSELQPKKLQSLRTAACLVTKPLSPRSY